MKAKQKSSFLSPPAGHTSVMHSDSDRVFVAGLVEKDTSRPLKADVMREARLLSGVPPESAGGIAENGQHCWRSLIGTGGASLEFSERAGGALPFHPSEKKRQRCSDAAGMGDVMKGRGGKRGSELTWGRGICTAGADTL